jgi:gliding motility-associated-like protein
MVESRVEAGFLVTPAETDLGDPVVTFTDQSTGASGCVIKWGDGNVTSCDSVNHTYTTSGTFSIGELVTNTYGCSDSTFRTVVIDPMPEVHLFIPNAFTPDGDGLNDIFRINKKDVTDFTLLIYARWGQLLFTTSDPGRGWDGTFNGALCPEGVYTYSVRFRDSSSGRIQDYQGYVTLLR